MFAVWKKLATEHNNTLDEDEVTLFVEMLCTLIPKNDFKSFFNVSPYKTTEKIRDERKSGILMSVMTLDDEINKITNAKPNATRESLGKILSKPIKATKVKAKKVKPMSKKQKQHLLKVEEIAKSKERKRLFLRDRVLSAKSNMLLKR